MSNINKIKNEKTAEENNPQISNIIMDTTENNNLINNSENTGIFYNILKYKKNPTLENTKNNKPFSLLKVFHKRKDNFEAEFFDNFDIYQTEGFYREGKYTQNIIEYIPCRLLIKENYFYVLKNNNRNRINNMYINPENSFLDKLDSHNIIEKQEIKYAKYDYELSKPLLCLNLNLITCSLLINKKDLNEFTILILGTKKQYSFIIKTPEIKNKFCYLLGLFIYNSDGYAMNKLNLIFSHPKHFNKKTYITPEYFEYIAKTGDLILFQTNHILTKAQRCYTCDKYDHIALIFKNYGLLSLFDASKKNKCQYHYWGTFMATLNHISFFKVVYRRLNIEEKNMKKKIEIQNKIEKDTEEFLEQVIDKKYHLSLCNILFKGRPDEYELNQDWNQAEGFSCSSLIAAYYIKLGIIQLDKTIHSILPGDFEENKYLNFLPGFSLGPEKIIEFSS